jgi:hypothetical protein
MMQIAHLSEPDYFSLFCSLHWPRSIFLRSWSNTTQTNKMRNVIAGAVKELAAMSCGVRFRKNARQNRRSELRRAGGGIVRFNTSAWRCQAKFLEAEVTPA